MSTRQFCTFHLEDLFFGIEVLEVQEVIRYQEMTKVPLAPPEVEGLINLRGQIVTAIDMRRRLALPERGSETAPLNIITRTSGDMPVSLLVDEIGEVLEVDQEDYEPTPQTLQSAAREVIQGAYKLPDQLLLVLDTQEALRVSGQPAADAAPNPAHN